MTTAPTPARVAPSVPLLDLCTFLVEAAYDLSQQAQAPHDRDEVLAKLDGIAEQVAAARAAYLETLQRGGL